jgi:transmembrane sensor
MNPSPRKPDSAADEQAALWAARLDGDTLDRSQRTELDAWLAEEPAHRVLLSRYCQLSADLEQVPQLVAAGVVAMPASARPAQRRRISPRLAFLTMAAAAGIALAVTVLRPTAAVQNVAMAPAQRGSRTLSDGTRVELNANTTLRFENNRTERRVRLAGGEALFAVAKDSARPFVVETPAGSVRVTGTTFNVRTEASRHGFEVTVIEGSVQVRPGGSHGVQTPGPVSLVAGDQFSSVTGEVRPLSASRLDDSLAWRQGRIVFHGVPLNEAAARFAQYHGCAIHIAPALAQERVGGVHSIDDLSGFLAGLELALPGAKVQRDLSGAVSVNLRPGS